MKPWPRRRLKDLGTWFGGGTPSKARSEFWTGGTVPWLSPKDMGPETLTSTKDHITKEAVEQSSTRLVPAGSVATVVRSGILERSIPVALVPFETTLNQDMKALVPTTDIDPRWVAWGLRAFERDLLQSCRKAGTTVASMEMQRLYDFEFPVPPMDEQRRILDTLEDHLSRLDAAESGCEASEQRLRALRQSSWMSSFRPEPLSDQYVTVPLLDVVTISNGQTPKGLSDVLTSERGDDSVPFFKVGDMNSSDARYMDATRSFVTRDQARSLRLHIRPPGIVLIPKRGGAIATNKKRILRTEAAYDLNTMGLQPGHRILSEYLWNWLEGIDLAKLADGSNVPQINSPQIRGLALPLPDLASQAAIVDTLDSHNDETEQLKSALNDVKRRARRLRSALLAAAFSGRLTGRSSDMDLVEEMAEV